MTTATGNVGTPASSALYGRAQRVIPGGVNSPVRAMRSIGRDPIFVASAAGAHIRDVDDNDYVDWVCSWGPLILGHAHPDVVRAVTDAARRGTTFGAPTAAEVELAEQICGRLGSVEMVRMTSSGTEASMSAIRLARAVTGREKVLKFAGGYHGHVDGLLSQAGSGLATQGIPASPGVPEAAAAATITVPFNDIDAVAAAADGGQLAAIIVEPVPANMGVVPAADGFLAAVAAIARAAGTLSGNPLAVAAGLATLALLDDGAYARVAAVTERLTAGLREAAASAGRPDFVVQSVPGLLTPFFCARAPRDYAEAQATDQAAYGAFCRALLAHGVYPPASQFEAWFPSTAHTDADIDRTVEAAADALAAI